MITTFATFGCMVLLAWFKYLIAYKVDSRALRTDGKVADMIHVIQLEWKQNISFTSNIASEFADLLFLCKIIEGARKIRTLEIKRT